MKTEMKVIGHCLVHTTELAGFTALLYSLYEKQFNDVLEGFLTRDIYRIYSYIPGADFLFQRQEKGGFLERQEYQGGRFIFSKHDKLGVGLIST